MLLWAFLLKKYRAWRIYRETYTELAGLDDRTLADINVARGDISRIAHRAALQVAA
ncbi:DUF1127 domain-containing protein [Chelatococcus sambhunathii]|uniref:DUF1127 domain-containing protein n=1 Tax=Chelatococcus sambhunathii TaxID=363953 RepID=A0ABU1DB54_9HYPH|nr:DUF1127 domain-containing protein [Chelatococcus sambhunathii]MDR4305290.1 DUF1127 domain-containing protein [Chelatococcus sambhunathii]